MNYICSACIGDPVLRQYVSMRSDPSHACDHCNEQVPTVTIWFVAEQCDEVLSTFYDVTSQTIAVTLYDHTPAGTSLCATIDDLLASSSDVVEAVVETLKFMWYDRDSGEHKFGEEDPWFKLKSEMESQLTGVWVDIENSLRSEARYLNPKAFEFLRSVFHAITQDTAKNGSPVLVDVGPVTSTEKLYRARFFQTEDALVDALKYPERLLGSPAAGVGGAGRMNAAGQPAFYGATDISTALAEIRPPVGSWVVTAQFAIVKPLKLLDLRLARQIQLYGKESLFDPRTKDNAHRRAFLRALCDKMVVPVMPESQDRDYLITQVVADYLAMYPRESISGIVYPSIQRNSKQVSPEGSNIVLFSKAAIVEGADGKKETASVQLWDYEDEGPGKIFCPTIIFHQVPPVHPSLRLLPGLEPSLQLIRGSITIHRVDYVDIGTTATEVQVDAHSWPKSL